MKNIMELYRRGMPIRATFFLFFGLFSIGMIIISIVNMIIVGIFVGLFFAALNFSWLPATYLEDRKESKDVNNDIKETNTVNDNVEHKKSTDNDRLSSPFQPNDKRMAVVEELSADYVKIIYKDFKYYYHIPQNTPKTIEAMPQKDAYGKVVPQKVKEQMLEAFKSFKPKTREGDSRHIILMDNYDMYNRDNHDYTYFDILDEKYKSKVTDDYRDSLLLYLKVKAIRKYTRGEGNDKTYYIELGNLENTYIFEDEFEVSQEMYDLAEEGKEYVVLKYGLCRDHQCFLYESSFLD